MFIYRMEKENLNNSSVKQSFSTDAAGLHQPHHPYHLVDPSPWPAFTSLCMLWL